MIHPEGLTKWTNMSFSFFQAAPFAFGPTRSAAAARTHGRRLLNVSVADRPATAVSRPAGQDGRRPPLPDEGTVGRHFQLAAATWRGIIRRTSAKY